MEDNNMKSITIKIRHMDNDAFEEADGTIEAARILRELAKRIEEGRTPIRLFDINGNAVGTVKMVE